MNQKPLAYERRALADVIEELEAVAADCGILLARAQFLLRKLEKAAKAEFGPGADLGLDLQQLLLEEIAAVAANPPQPKGSFVDMVTAGNPRTGLFDRVEAIVGQVDTWRPPAAPPDPDEQRGPGRVLCQPIATGQCRDQAEEDDFPTLGSVTTDYSPLR